MDQNGTKWIKMDHNGLNWISHLSLSSSSSSSLRSIVSGGLLSLGLGLGCAALGCACAAGRPALAVWAVPTGLFIVTLAMFCCAALKNRLFLIKKNM